MELYDVLGVRREASTADVRRAYQKLARSLHPDLNPGDAAAAARFAVVSRAFEVLSDPQRRAEYDRGAREPRPASRVPEVGFEGFDFSAEVSVAGVHFRDIFAGVLRPAPKLAMPGEDLEQATRVTFEECFRGAHRRIHLVRQAPCESCGGVGRVTTGPLPCSTCRGSGQVRANRGRMVFSRRCADCAGTGVLDDRVCGRCDDGRVMRSEWLEVDIPPGVDDGSRLRVPGCGNAGRRGGPPGDFVLVMQAEPHPFYRRQGCDLQCEVPVTITEAALGGHIEVPTPDGPMNIEIPSGTQNGQRFRLRKRGLPRLGEKVRGDLFVEARIWVPRVEDEGSRELLREFARRNPKGPRQQPGDLPPLAAGRGR
jgi:molecular chaperone DnaJ